jgi:excisionase family DNA binding protein
LKGIVLFPAIKSVDFCDEVIKSTNFHLTTFARFFAKMLGTYEHRLAHIGSLLYRFDSFSNAETTKSRMLPSRMQAEKSTPDGSVANSAAEQLSAQLSKPFTKRELSTFLGISERFIELEVNRGRLCAVRLSNRLLRFRRIDVDRWMESSLTAAGESRRSEH